MLAAAIQLVVDRFRLINVVVGPSARPSQHLSQVGPPSTRTPLLGHALSRHPCVHRQGVGSVSTRAWILLMLGRDGNDPQFLPANEAQEPVLERFVGKSRYPNDGQRVVVWQRLMQAASDIFLGIWSPVGPAAVQPEQTLPCCPVHTMGPDDQPPR